MQKKNFQADQLFFFIFYLIRPVLTWSAGKKQLFRWALWASPKRISSPGKRVVLLSATRESHPRIEWKRCSAPRFCAADGFGGIAGRLHFELAREMHFRGPQGQEDRRRVENVSSDMLIAELRSRVEHCPTDRNLCSAWNMGQTRRRGIIPKA